MNIARITVYSYSLKFRRPIAVRAQTLDRRDGFILKLTSDEHNEGYGEAAPLAGFSRESAAQAEGQLRDLHSRLRDEKIPDDLAAFNGQFERWLGPLDLVPSVRFGLESAVLHLLANARKSPIHKLLPAASGHPVRVAGLISAANGDIGAQTRALIQEGFTELKLKVGGHPGDDAANVKAVNAVANGKALVHVDANQRWNYEAALAFGKAAGCGSVSYIEEPFKEIERIQEFYDETMIPVALDESLTRLSFEEIRGISGVEAIVIKPTILGGIEKTIQLMAQAESFAIRAVISSAYESSLGIWTLANIAAAMPDGNAAGLDTLKYFHEDIIVDPIHLRHGKMCAGNRMLRSKDMNFNLLRELK